MRFEFATAARIVFGRGSVREAGAITRSFGQRALVVVGRETARAQPLIATLASADVEHSFVEIHGEPSIEQVTGAVELARQNRFPVVIGFGGGSAIDAAKAIAGLATNPGGVYDFLEVIGKGHPLLAPSLACIALPTTAGTGAEVTKNAVLASKTAKVKVSLRSPFLLPRAAIVDPELTFELPPAATANTGLDALTQLIEPYTCLRANPLTDAFCLEGITRVASSLRTAFDSPKDELAREDMALASLLGGLSLANAGLGAVHGFAGPIGGSFPAPHGAICAALLPHVMEVNVNALRTRDLNPHVLQRYDKIAKLLTGSEKSEALDGVRWVAELCRDLKVGPLSRFGVAVSDIPALVEKAKNASSMKANPVPLTDEELSEALEKAL